MAGIAKEVSNRYGTGVHMVTIPATSSQGVTRQDETVVLAQELADSLGEVLDVLPFDGVVDEAVSLCDLGASQWGMGQAVSYLRTAVAYTYVTKCWSVGDRTLLVGTTNMDEGAYIGFFGKASDGMVDIQPISDLHKSEVYQVANYLEIPASIIQATPQGDVYHGGKDEQIFGCTYDCVELFYATHIGRYVDSPVSGQWKRIVDNIEDLHQYNTHKYFGGSPAVHMDVMPYAGAFGSWSYQNIVDPRNILPSPLTSKQAL